MLFETRLWVIIYNMPINRKDGKLNRSTCKVKIPWHSCYFFIGKNYWYEKRNITRTRCLLKLRRKKPLFPQKIRKQGFKHFYIRKPKGNPKLNSIPKPVTISHTIFRISASLSSHKDQQIAIIATFHSFFLLPLPLDQLPHWKTPWKWWGRTKKPPHSFNNLDHKVQVTGQWINDWKIPYFFLQGTHHPI